MKKFYDKVKGAAIGVAGSVVAASPALATTNWYDEVTLDTTAVTTIAGTVLSALAVIWTIRKAVKLTNRS